MRASSWVIIAELPTLREFLFRHLYTSARCIRGKLIKTIPHKNVIIDISVEVNVINITSHDIIVIFDESFVIINIIVRSARPHIIGDDLVSVVATCQHRKFLMSLLTSRSLL